MRRIPYVSVVLALFGALVIAGLVATPTQAQQTKKLRASAIQVFAVECDEVKLPPAFEMALYENLIDQVRKTGKFERIYRDGERGAADEANLVTLHSKVLGFKEGSERLRQVTTVAGATSIKVHVRIADRSGQSLVDRDVTGKVVFFGENLRATHNLAKSVAKIVRQNFQKEGG